MTDTTNLEPQKRGGAANLTNAGKGRPKGVPNKAGATMKAAIEAVYKALQEKNGNPHGHFLEWAEGAPTEFYKLASKLIPLQLAGDPDAPVSITVTRTILDPKGE